MQIYFNKGKAAKWDGDKFIKPKLGYNWFFWFPYLHWNHGIPFRHACTDITISWLMFWVGVTIYWSTFKGSLTKDDVLYISNGKYIASYDPSKD